MRKNKNIQIGKIAPMKWFLNFRHLKDSLLYLIFKSIINIKTNKYSELPFEVAKLLSL